MDLIDKEDVVNKRIKERICYSCGSCSSIPNWYKYYDEKENWDKRSWLCVNCYQKYNPNSSRNIIKSERQSRNKLLSKYSNIGKGFIGEMIVATVRCLKNCNLELDNFHAQFDLYDQEYGKIQVKTKQQCYGDWQIGIGTMHNFDTLFVLCMDKGYINVKRVYIIPGKELSGLAYITIIGNLHPVIGSKWEIFRTDEKVYNDTYHSMKIKDCPVLKYEK